jgi:hypothetical protein
MRTDAYSMSIGEWISLYENGEIDIHPEFQRFFRWTPTQKTRLIESILLGIPIPQIFVAQRSDGIWDVVDGLQRLSTIYQFVGILKDENGKRISPLALEATKYLPALEGKKWDDPRDKENSFTPAQRLYIKRAKIEVSIILKESDEASKYELFQRLNTGGSPLSDQEVRNCILVLLNREMFEWMRSLSKFDAFKECTALTDRAMDEQYDLELVLRFLVFRQFDEAQMRNIKDLGEFLTEKMIQLAGSSDFKRDEEEKAFKQTFTILQNSTGANSFRRYDPDRDGFIGGFLVSAYETVALGVGYNYKALSRKIGDIEKIIRNIWKHDVFIKNSGAGVRASTRIPNNIPLGRKMFRL